MVFPAARMGDLFHLLELNWLMVVNLSILEFRMIDSNQSFRRV